jgi:hypothetical protein
LICPLKFQCEGIVVLSNNVFWSFGRRFFQFDTFIVEDDDPVGNIKLDNGFPVYAILNTYLLNIFVVKKNEVRMYDLTSGKLTQLIGNIFQEEILKAEVTKFKIDARHRKAYVANNLGQIFVINCENGVILKQVTESHP